jgi:chromosome segregation ATPase
LYVPSSAGSSTRSLLSFLDELHEANNALKDDFHVVRNTVQTLDKEKEHLCSAIDLKTDENLRLTQEVNSKVRRLEELNRMLSELESALE